MLLCIIVKSHFIQQVLRFSRLFPPHYSVSMYKKKKKGEDQAEKKPPAIAIQKEIEMNWGHKPTPDQLAKDQHVSSLLYLKL